MNIDFRLWPNPDGELGVNKVTIPTGIGDDTWPDGDALVGNFVYKDGKLSGFVDTKALTVNESKSTTFPYDCVNIQVDKSLEGVMTFNKGERTKYFTITYTGSSNSGETFDFVIIDFNTTDQETIDTVRTAKRVIDNKLYDVDDNLIGTIDTSKIEVGGILDEEVPFADGLFCNFTMEGNERGFVLSEFNSDLSSLRDGDIMFLYCTNLTSFTTDLSSLTNGIMMFTGCNNLTTFSSDLSNLMYGNHMFQECNLTSFTSDLSNLTNGDAMFSNCKLDTVSVQNIAETINSNPPSGARINICIGNSTPNEDEIAAFNTIVAKGWKVYVNGYNQYTPSTAASIMTLDENGEETVTPIPFWAKPVPSDEQHAKYIDSEGNFYNILGAQFIYGDDISTYGMFTCEEDAAANMGLTKIEKPSIIPSFKKS